MAAVHRSFLVGSPKSSAAVSLAGAGPLGLFQRCVLSEDLVSGLLVGWLVCFLLAVHSTWGRGHWNILNCFKM